jgi:hypothetical protein
MMHPGILPERMAVFECSRCGLCCKNFGDLIRIERELRSYGDIPKIVVRPASEADLLTLLMLLNDDFMPHSPWVSQSSSIIRKVEDGRTTSHSLWRLLGSIGRRQHRLESFGMHIVTVKRLSLLH